MKALNYLGAAFCFVLLTLTAPQAMAQDYPARPIQIICPSAPGGGSDTLVRLLARELEKLSGQTVVVVNRAGAGGLVGTRAVLAAKPDGYTLLMHASSAIVGNSYAVKDSGYDARTDLIPIATVSQVGFALAVGPKSPVNSVAELTELLKAKKGKATYASPNNATVVATELYKDAIGADAVRINYKATTAAIADIAANEIDFTFADMTLALSQARTGRVRVLAVTPKERVSMDPNVMTMVEAGIPNYEYSTFFGLWAPKGTPQPVVDKLSGWVAKISAMPEFKAAMIRDGFEPLEGNAAKLARMVDEDAKRWEGLVKSGKIEAQ